MVYVQAEKLKTEKIEKKQGQITLNPENRIFLRGGAPCNAQQERCRAQATA